MKQRRFGQSKNRFRLSAIILLTLLTLAPTTPAQDWEVIPFPLNESITGLSFVHPDTGHLVTDGGKHARTFDGGKTWWGRQITTGHSLEDVHFLNGRVGAVCGRNRAIHLTSDGGDNWRQVSWPDSSVTLVSIRMLDSLTLLTVGLSTAGDGLHAGVALRSDDGGQKWTKPGLNGLAFGDLCCDQDGTVFCLSLGSTNYSQDKGLTWRTTKFGDGLPGRLLTLKGNNGIMVGNHGMCAYSTDKGANWKRVSLGDETRHFITAVMINDTVAYIGGTEASLLRTVDGGRNWTRELMAKSFDVLGLCLIGDWIWAAGTEGGIIRKKIR